MDSVGRLVKKEKKKIIATLIVAAVFLFFWINGPLMQSVGLLNLESIETKYSKPILVGEEGVDNKNISSFNTMTLNEEHTFGYGLVIDKKEPAKNWGLVADVKNNPNLSLEHKDAVFEHAKTFAHGYENISILTSMDMYYALVSVKGDSDIYLESTDLIKNIRGFAGEIHVGIFINKEGFITQVEHISSKETNSYLSDIKKSGFYKQFQTISLTRGSQEIDAVSGATITSKAIAQTVSALVEKGIPYPISNYNDVDGINTFSIEASLNKVWIFHIGVIFLMFAFTMQKWIKKTKKSVLALSLLSVIYIGFFLNNSFTYISFIHPFVGTSVSSLIGLYALFVLIGAIWGKNTYCKYVCPFGNIQRLIIQVNPLKTTRRFFISNKWLKRIRAAVTVILLTGVLLGLRNWSNFELFPDLFGFSTLGVWTIIAVITILTTLIYPMIWCRLLCPTGSILDGISDIMKYKRKHKHKP
ncbi:4Fe-4S binding protein [Maribacter polysiphoniae]|uniref:4Fe-4S binding protein n=1 Tax=Maribacter polysiphoniae TaxID=429344 RepID=UPI002353BEBB|nr:4Fe-4S binding protein [Maribacter polysiphoniae]